VLIIAILNFNPVSIDVFFTRKLLETRNQQGSLFIPVLAMLPTFFGTIRSDEE